jgi:hypothetical protein
MMNLKELRREVLLNNRYEKRLAALVSDNLDVARIKGVVEHAMENLSARQNSFVIYGEPQSGKTELMVALTARLLDEGFKLVLILLNDSVQLLGQNLERFQRSGLSPTPKKFSEILPSEVKIGEHQWVIFCKKNSKDLQKLIDKIAGQKKRVVIDDEADYATPNSQINKKEKSKINKLTEELIGREGNYIGVTATPARLDLNRTHKNQNESWIDFPPHSEYTGQDVFFPVSIENLGYSLTLLPDAGDDPKYLKKAFFSFIVNVSYLNRFLNKTEKNYSFLIHTSSKKADHTVDYKQVVKLFEALRDDQNGSHEKYFTGIWEIANERYPGQADEIIRYALENVDRYNLVVMNSDKEVNAASNGTATDPTAPFTVIIGGNIVSRGVTFKNLLSMFFTRDVKHKLQQDTYIQRARMFGSRNSYLKYFELTIPKTLYLNWQTCFIFHRLSLESRKQTKTSPVWLDGERITAVASGSIDKTQVHVDKGEMSFDIFDFDSPKIQQIINQEIKPIQKVKALSELLGKDCLPDYLIDFIERFCPLGDASVAVHLPNSIAGYTDKEGEVDKATITRTKGFIGQSQLEIQKYPDAVHHINVIHNERQARVFYKYIGNVRFLKTRQK